MAHGIVSLTAAALLFLAAARSRAEGPAQGEVYLGEPSTAAGGLWSSVVQLWYRDADCSGTLIAPDVVLTAAHCIKTDSGLELPDTIRFYGITDRRDRETGLHDVELYVDHIEGLMLLLRRADNAGICDGDSGGPAFVVADSGERLVAGVASASEERSRCHTVLQSRFSSVPQAYSWISANLAAFASGEYGAHAQPSQDTVDVVAERTRRLARRLPRHVRPLSVPLLAPRF